MILAIGALMDPEQPAYGLEAEKYHQVAKAALFQTAMTDDPTLNAVQAVVSVLLFISRLVLKTIAVSHECILILLRSSWNIFWISLDNNGNCG